jgi:hypothetical protein
MKFLETDFLSLALAKFREIPKEYVRSFVIIFIAINVAFAYHTFSFMWGDHDWNRLLDTMKLNDNVSFGRFSVFMHFSLLTGNNILPVLNNLYAFAVFALSSILLCIYWKVPRSTFHYSIIGILLCIQPYTLMRLFFLFALLPHLGLPFLVIVALIFSERAALCGKRWKTIAYLSFAIVLNALAFGTYPPIVNTIVVVFIGRIIIDVFMGKENGVFAIIKGILLRQRYAFLTIAGGALLFEIILLILKSNGITVSTTYHLQTIGIKDFVPHLMHVSYEAFKILWYYPLPFFPSVLVSLRASLFIFGFFVVGFNLFVGVRQSERKIRIGKSIILLILFISIIIFSKTTSIISPELRTLYRPSILFFGDPFLFVFPLALIFSQRFNFPKTMAVLVSIVLICICLVQDSKALKVWKFDFEAEKMLWNRVMTRIEENEDYNPNKKYRLIFIGTPPAYSYHYYRAASDKENDFAKKVREPLRGAASIQPAGAFSFFFPDLYTTDFSRRLLSHLREDDKKSQAIKDFAFKFRNHINDMHAYPHKNSILIKDNSIIIAFSESELESVKKILKKDATEIVKK